MPKEPLSQGNNLDVISFTNVDSEDFTCTWGSRDEQIGMDAGGKPDYVKVPIPYTVKAGETKSFPRFLAYHLTKHLIDKILLRSKGDHGAAGREEMEARILGEKIVAVEPEKLAELAKEEFAEVPKDEPSEERPEEKIGLRCEVCKKEFKHRLGLAGHSRSHK